MTDTPQPGQLAPNFSAPNQAEKITTLADFQGKWLVLYFYPKDDTPGCTTEAKDFSEYAAKFQQLGAEILGVSTDLEKTHTKFINKHNLTINLLSDPQHEIADSYGVWKLKKFMGKEYMGIERSTFLITPDQQIAHIWIKVKVKGHVEAVLEKLQAIQTA